MDIVRVVNVGDTLHTFAYGGARYPVAPGDSATIPVQAAWRSLGNWNRHDTEQHKARAEERSRLNTLYGLQGGTWYSQTPMETAAIGDTDARGKPLVDPKDYDPVATASGQQAFMHPSLPKIEVYDTETGTRVLTVIDDPDDDVGSGVSVKRAERDRVAMVEEQVAKQASLLETLVRELATTNPEKAAEIAAQLNAPRTPTPTPTVDHADATSTDDAMDVMNDELGIGGEDRPKPRKKAAAKKAAARRGDDE